MYNTLLQRSFFLNHWVIMLIVIAVFVLAIERTVMKMIKAHKEPPADAPNTKYGYLLLAIFEICLLLNAMHGSMSHIERVVKANDPMQCDLWRTPVVRMVSTSQWSRNQEGVTITGCNLNSRLKVVVEQHVKGNAVINPAIPFQLLSENQLVIHVNRINWAGFQDGEIVLTIIDPDKSPSWRGSIAELRAGQISGGRQLVTLSTRD